MAGPQTGRNRLALALGPTPGQLLALIAWPGYESLVRKGGLDRCA